MPLHLRDLLAEPTLRLTALTSHCGAEGQPISWVSTTELPDPAPFLRGGELVMTTGMLDRSPEQWSALVDALTGRPVAGLCFGVGLVHQDVPVALVEAAEESGLALVSSPVDIPFIQISRFVADHIFAEQYEAIRTAARVQDELVRELLSRRGIDGLMRVLHRRLAAGQVAVVGHDGRVVARYPKRRRGAGAATVRETHVGEPGTEATVAADGHPVARIVVEHATPHVEALTFAATILGLELARQRAVLMGTRQLLGQVIEDVVHRTISDADARRRLGLHGIEATAPHALVVASIRGHEDRLAQVPWALGPDLVSDGDVLPTALVGATLVVLVPDEVDADDVATRVADFLRALDPDARIGVSTSRSGAAGLRLGYTEAVQAGRAGPGIRRVAPLSLTGLLLGNLDLPLGELGRGVLGGLLEWDTRRGTALVATLRSYLEHDGQAGPTARSLALHRNGLRHRLQQIEQVTGRDLDRLEDRVELWLALKACDAAGAPGSEADHR